MLIYVDIQIYGEFIPEGVRLMVVIYYNDCTMLVLKFCII